MQPKWFLTSTILATFILASFLVPVGSFTLTTSEPLVSDAKITALSTPGTPPWFVVDGLVENSLNISYSELYNFPLVSEVTTLHCVGSGNGTGGKEVNYNWTGVPLFVILEMAGATDGAYRRVVFNATDGFSDSIMLDTAMNPTTILALRANGTDLEQVTGFGASYRVVLPGRWGYKWVKWIKQIKVVDYLYKGNYEKFGLPDDALRPGFALPVTSPAIVNYSLGKVQVLTNGNSQSFRYNPHETLSMSISAKTGTNAYLYVALDRTLLAEPLSVRVNGSDAAFSIASTNSTAYIFVGSVVSGSMVEIVGALQNYAGGHEKIFPW